MRTRVGGPKAARRRFGVLAAAVLTAAISAVATVAAPAPAASPESAGRIAFSSIPPEAREDGVPSFEEQELYTIDPDGTGRTRLTTNSVAEEAPAFSPDGTRIAFVSRDAVSGSGREVFVMNADGSGRTQLTFTADHEFDPAFSPDGSRIAFTRSLGGLPGNDEIVVMNADGSGQTQLTFNPGLDMEPKFSPDGTRIVFASLRDGRPNPDVYVMNADGSGAVNLSNNVTGNDRGNAEPEFSPDGTRIVFSSTRSGNSYEVFVMDADGSDQVQLTPPPGGLPSGSRMPTFSRDGARIAFTSLLDDGGLHLMNADGTGLVPLTADGYDDEPDWGGSTVPVPAPLTVVADDKSMQYGAPVPSLTATYTGFVDGDTPASLSPPATCTTTGTATSPVGTYPITCSGAVSPRYTFTYQAGTLTVTRAATSLRASPLLSTALRPTARLTRSDSGAPLGGQTVEFTAGGTRLCSAVTDPDGTARCRSIALALGGYRAAYAGGPNYEPSSATAGLLRR